MAKSQCVCQASVCKAQTVWSYFKPVSLVCHTVGLSTRHAKNLGYCIHSLAVCVASHLYHHIHRFSIYTEYFCKCRHTHTTQNLKLQWVCPYFCQPYNQLLENQPVGKSLPTSRLSNLKNASDWAINWLQPKSKVKVFFQNLAIYMLISHCKGLIKLWYKTQLLGTKDVVMGYVVPS